VDQFLVFCFSTVVVAKNRLCTTTTRGLRKTLLFAFRACFDLLTACAISHKQNTRKIFDLLVNDLSRAQM